METQRRISRYRLLREIGRGGMGVVWSAHDELLDRAIAIKLIRQVDADEHARRRFWREARLGASVGHPNLCAVHDVGEEDDVLFIAMEYLEGEPLSRRIARGPLSVKDALAVALGVLSALQALHARGLVHRDLKPSNVFLTPHGVKLLDFGLARSLPAAGSDDTATQLTQAGTVVGTPRYMAPEQIQGVDTNARTDLFAAGALVFEMLTGRPAFDGRTSLEIFHATLYEQPPALAGSSAVVAIDRVLRQAMAKRPEDRPSSAAAMAEGLQAALRLGEGSDSSPVRARSMTRLIVLPFRVLRPDAETDFLAYSLPDAITTSLSGLNSLLVRSSSAAERFASGAPDLQRIAAEAEVDVVLTGTLLRDGDELRVSTQLAEAPSGTLVWSHSSQARLGNVFQLQDELVTRIVESLAIPLTVREQRLLRKEVPASARAYEFYLRANDLARSPDHWTLARDLYVRCLEEDQRYAPAWARLAHCHRLIAKFGPEREGLASAETAFRRALELNPDLPIAHNLYTYLQADLGQGQAAMVRLLRRAQGALSDPELFAGLVHACRYCGLLEASVAAHHHARRLDPRVVTSVSNSYFMKGEYEACLAMSAGDLSYLDAQALMAIGRLDEARAILEQPRETPHAVLALGREAFLATLAGARGALIAAWERMRDLGMVDPEGRYYMARPLAHLGEHQAALAHLGWAVEHRFDCLEAFRRDPWLASLRQRSEFENLIRVVEAHRRENAAAFTEAGGENLLGVAAG